MIGRWVSPVGLDRTRPVVIQLTRSVVVGTLLEVIGRWVLRPVVALCCVRSSLDRWDRELSI